MRYKHRRPMVRDQIDQLNADAAAMVQGEMATEDAIRAAARVANLILVRERADALLYRSRRGGFVTARLRGPHGTYIGPGGAGFDAQIDWPDE